MKRKRSGKAEAAGLVVDVVGASASANAYTETIGPLLQEEVHQSPQTLPTPGGAGTTERSKTILKCVKEKVVVRTKSKGRRTCRILRKVKRRRRG